jgi:23S rRNA U2552 (ribose-2'-O)-methylase RlmE/FtsJ
MATIVPVRARETSALLTSHCGEGAGEDIDRLAHEDEDIAWLITSASHALGAPSPPPSAMPLSGSSHAWVARQSRDPFVLKAAADGYRSRAAYKLLDLQSRFRLIARGNVVLDLGAAPGSWSQVAAELCASRGDVAAVAAAAAAAAAAGAGGGGARLAAPPFVARRRSVFDLAAVEMDAAAAAAAPPGTATDDAPRHQATATPRFTGGGGSSGGLVVAVDLLPIQPLKGVVVLQGDFTKATVQERVFAVVQAHRRGSSSSGGSGSGASPTPSSSSLADVLLSDMAHSFTGEGHTDHLRQTLLSWTALAAAPTFLRRGGHAAVKVKYGQEYKPLVAAFTRRFRRLVEVKPPASRAESSEAYLVGLGWCGRARALAAVTPDEEAALRQFGLAWPAPPPVQAAADQPLA